MTDQLTAQDIQLYRDLHKDVHGVRPPHGCHPQGVAEYRREMDRLAAMLAEQQDAENAEARARGFANHAVWFWFWANQEELLMDIDAVGPSERWCPIKHDDGTGALQLDHPETDDVPAGCARSRCATDRWYAGAL
jgi:hypothetical protein